MAGALRPVVVLMAIASALLVADGVMDGVYPGGRAWLNGAYHGFGWTAYLFAALNLLVALMVARGSERSLIARIGLSGFFLVERPLTAFVLSPPAKDPAAIGVHAATVLVELVILLGALRVWRLGRAFADEDVSEMFSMSAGSPMVAAVAARSEQPAAKASSAWVVGLLALALAGVLVADAALQRFLPGGRVWGFAAETIGWTSYVLAIAVLSVAARAVRGTLSALRLQLALALLLFLERAFSPFVVPLEPGSGLVLHAFAAFFALALALASVGVMRDAPVRARALEVA